MSPPTEQLVTLLRDNLWSSVGGIFLPIIQIIFKKMTRGGESYKEITYRIHHETPGEIIITLWNSGNVAIDASDFYEPFTFSFTGKGAQVHAAYVLRERPDRIGVQCNNLQGNMVILNSFLFKPQEEIALQFQAPGTQEVDIKVRINSKEVRNIVEHLKKQRGIIMCRLGGFGLSFLLWCGTIILYDINHSNNLFNYVSLFLSVCSSLCATALIISIISYITDEKRYQ